METKVRFAALGDGEAVVDLRNQVQAALTASGSLQELDALNTAKVNAAIARKECFVLQHTNGTRTDIIGCAFVRQMVERSHFQFIDESIDILKFPKPWPCLHTFMLHPSLQRKGLGLPFLADIVDALSGHPGYASGTLFLDCWDGNTKLRDFYNRASFDFLGIAYKGFHVAVFYHSLDKGIRLVN